MGGKDWLERGVAIIGTFWGRLRPVYAHGPGKIPVLPDPLFRTGKLVALTGFV